VSTTDAPKEARQPYKAYKDRHGPIGSVLERGYQRVTLDAGGGVIQMGNKIYGGWTVITGQNDFDWQVSTGTEVFDDVAFPPEFCSGSWRCLATGCEVTNTTAELYKGGSVTVYRSPSSSTPTCMLSSGGTIITPRGVGLTPPSTQTDAALYTNSKTWDADSGCYIIATLNDPTNPYFTPSPGFAGLITPASSESLETGAGWLGYFPLLQDVAVATAASGMVSMDSSGAIFNGLNTNSTLQVTVRYFLEKIPTVADANLLVLARTPAPYDPMTLEIYARALNELPVGVPVGENPMGEWFNDVISAVAEWAPKIGQALGAVGVPLAGPIGNMVGGFAKGRLKERITEKPDGTVTTTVTEKPKKTQPPPKPKPKKAKQPQLSPLEIARLAQIARGRKAKRPYLKYR